MRKTAESKTYEGYPLEKSSVFVLGLLVALLFIFGVASLVAYNSYRVAIKNAVYSNDTRANLLAKLVLEHQRAAIGVLQAYASRPLLIDSVKKKDFDKAIIHLSSLVENHTEIEWPFLTAPDGTLWGNFPVDSKALNKNFSYREWYQGVTKEWKPYVSNVFKMIVGEQELAVAVCSPVRDEKGKVIGILCAAQRTGFFKKIISEMGLDVDAKMTLIDKDGDIIYSNRFPYKKEVVRYPLSGFIRKATKEKKGNVEIRDSSDGDRVKFISFSPVEGIGWSVIVERPRREVLRSELANLTVIAVISLLVYTVVILSLVYIRDKYKQMAALKNQAEILRESQDRLRTLTSQLFTAQENERKRMAHEIHDGLGASLAAIKFKVEDALQKAENKSMGAEDPLETVARLVQECVEESRRIQMDLRPSVLDDLGIVSALSWHCRRFQTTYPNIHVETKLNIQENEVPDTLRTLIYRISQEALNNVAKHSAATLVDLSLRKVNETVELTIQDNGHGFDREVVLSRESSRKGLGLSSMRERAELSGGSFSIESTRGKGTVIRASWPL